MRTKLVSLVGSVHYSTFIVLCLLAIFVSCGVHTQSYSAQRIHQIEFEECVDGEYSDAVCDSCYHAVLDPHNYWFNNDLYNTNGPNYASGE